MRSALGRGSPIDRTPPSAWPDPTHYKAPYVWPSWREGKPLWQLAALDNYMHEGFSASSLIYGAVMYKARAITQAPLRAYSGTPDAPEALPPEHPLSELVARPNVSSSWIEFQQAAMAFLNLTGNCYIMLDRENTALEGLPSAMYLLRPDRVYIIPGDRGILGFAYVNEGKPVREIVPILPSDVIHVKLPNPADPLEGLGYGLSPITPMARSADVDADITRFLKLFFQNGAMPPGALKFKTSLDRATADRARERWKEVYGGVDNWSEIAILDNDAEYVSLTPTFEQMGFASLDERNESRILGPFGVPPILVGSRIGLAHATMQNYEEARRQCWEDTLVPELRLFEVEYSHFLRGADGSFVAFDLSEVPALSRDIGGLVGAAVQLFGIGVPLNQALSMVGLPGVDTPYKEIPFVLSTFTPVERAMTPPAPVPPQLLPAGAISRPPSGKGDGGRTAEEDGQERGTEGKA